MSGPLVFQKWGMVMGVSRGMRPEMAKNAVQPSPVRFMTPVTLILAMVAFHPCSTQTLPCAHLP